jgi:hypothetical protein
MIKQSAAQRDKAFCLVTHQNQFQESQSFHHALTLGRISMSTNTTQENMDNYPYSKHNFCVAIVMGSIFVKHFAVVSQIFVFFHLVFTYLLHIPEVLGSNIGQEAGYPE